MWSRVGAELEVTKFREVRRSLGAGAGWGWGLVAQAPPFAELISRCPS